MSLVLCHVIPAPVVRRVVVGDFSVDGNERERTDAGGTKASLTSSAAAVPPARPRPRPPVLPSDQGAKLGDDAGGRVINCFIAHFSAPLIDRL